LVGTGAEMWRVRTIGYGRPSASMASAASQESVELCVLMTSQRFFRNHSAMHFRPTSRFLPIGAAITGRPQAGASA